MRKPKSKDEKDFTDKERKANKEKAAKIVKQWLKPRDINRIIGDKK